MMCMRMILPLLLLSGHSLAQRGSYAGKRPIGYPVITTTTTTGTAGIVDRFGEDGVTTTTMRLPPEALGDRELVDRISKLPVDKQPFWYLNWQALEANRNKPQYTDPNRPSFVNQFVESNAQTLGSRFGDDTQQTGIGSSSTQPASSNTNMGNVLADATRFNGGSNNEFRSVANNQASNFIKNGQSVSGSSSSNRGVAQSAFTNDNSQTSASLQNRMNGFRHTPAHHHRELRPSLHGEGFRIRARQWDSDALRELDN